MTTNLSLSRDPAKVLPTALNDADGKAYPIDSSFRAVLACLRILSDPDRAELDKALYIARRFFLNHPPAGYAQLFSDFVTGGEPTEDEPEPLMDFELDAGVIYASFRQQYGIDLLSEDLHWVAFRALLSGLTEDTPFGARVRLREMDPADVPEKERPKLRKLQDMVAITPRISRREAELQAELDRRLAAGEDPTEIIEKLREV